MIALLVSEIATETNDAVSYNQAIEMGKETYLTTEYASHYGGYRLVRVRTVSGGHCAPFKGMSDVEGRKKASEMETYLRGILIGMGIKSN